MTWNPVKAYRLAAEAERANEALAKEPSIGGAMLDIKVRALVSRLRNQRELTAGIVEINRELASASAVIAAERDALAAKIKRMTGNLKRGSVKPSL